MTHSVVTWARISLGLIESASLDGVEGRVGAFGKTSDVVGVGNLATAPPESF